MKLIWVRRRCWYCCSR